MFRLRSTAMSSSKLPKFSSATTAPSTDLLVAVLPAHVAVPATRTPPGLAGLGLEVTVTGRDSDIAYSALPAGGFVNDTG